MPADASQVAGPLGRSTGSGDSDFPEEAVKSSNNINEKKDMRLPLVPEETRSEAQRVRREVGPAGTDAPHTGSRGRARRGRGPPWIG
eukprot:2245773-Alexandrium_andersonii.AAC.1